MAVDKIMRCKVNCSERNKMGRHDEKEVVEKVIYLLAGEFNICFVVPVNEECLRSYSYRV